MDIQNYHSSLSLKEDHNIDNIEIQVSQKHKELINASANSFYPPSLPYF